MIDMARVRRFLIKTFTPVTIMIVPHSKWKPLSVRLPVAAILALLGLWGLGTLYIVSVGVQTAKYYEMSQKVSYFSAQFLALHSTIASLENAEHEFRRLFSLKSKKNVLEAVGLDDDKGSLDVELLKKQASEAISSIAEIRHYVSNERNVYFATPVGRPVVGRVTSHFGKRADPLTGRPAFHSGVDISVSSGTPVKATANGIVSVSGYMPGNGYVVAIEHGRGFRTIYAHNSKNLAKVGQTVKRGQVIAMSGSTGRTTGPHLHYEVWKRGVQVSPMEFIEERS